MTFAKPDIRYVDMCIYVDENVYKEDFDGQLIYEYLYHIIMMLSMKRNYFDRVGDHDDFSLYAASIYYMRLTDKRQFEENPPIEPIRSILNYIKKTLFSIRAEYCKKYQRESIYISDLDYVELGTDSFANAVNKIVDPLKKYEFTGCLESVDKLIKQTLSDIPYKKDSVLWNNIYISCMLSFLNSITLKNKDIKRLNNFKRPTSLTDSLVNELYMKERNDCIILYHLDDNMYNYITVLTNKLKHKISQELSQALKTELPPVVTMKNLLMSNVLEEDCY